MTITDALFLSEKLMAFALILQGFEFFIIRNSFSQNGVWRFETLKNEMPFLFKALLKDKSFPAVLALRFLCAIGLFFYSSPFLIGVLLISTALITMRWRGTFNGGSDYMTVIVLLSLLVVHLFQANPLVIQGALYYVALQVCVAFFISGFVKLKKQNWRRGVVLPWFFSVSVYEESQVLKAIKGNQKAMMALSWTVILFELLLPLSLLNSQVALVFIGMAILFQLGNLYLFGLNRFVWSWLAAYPALYWVSI